MRVGARQSVCVVSAVGVRLLLYQGSSAVVLHLYMVSWVHDTISSSYLIVGKVQKWLAISDVSR